MRKPLLAPKGFLLSCGLTEDFVGKDPKLPVHIGATEVDRLFGADAEYGNGRLPRFLSLADQLNSEGAPIHTIHVRDLHDHKDPGQMPELMLYGDHNMYGTPGAEFVSPIRHTVRLDENVINTTTLSIPLAPFREMMSRLLGKDLMELTAEDRELIRIGLVGVHTGKMVMSIAQLLRNNLEFPHVGVCPHLVGSTDQLEHSLAIQRGFRSLLVEVVPGTEDYAQYMGLGQENLGEIFPRDDCEIGPEEALQKLNPDQQSLLKLLFVDHDSIELKFLGGGFSGSALMYVIGKKNGAKTAPSIVKIDRHQQMQREIQGYEKTRHYLGQNVPKFEPPVSFGEFTGIKMAVAAMKGTPRTLQALLEKAESPEELEYFLSCLKEALEDLSNSLYRNTKKPIQLYPYQHLGLHADLQKKWLRGNTQQVVGEDAIDRNEIRVTPDVSVANFFQNFDSITNNSDRITIETSLSHGDLNLANLISDDRGNVWSIDWTHAKETLTELDFAKIENDIKFVIVKEITDEDLPLLKELEEFFQTHLKLPEIDQLPANLAFIKDEMRFRKIYLGVKTVRDAFIEAKESEDALMYQMALLRYSTHTLSFDERTGRGECRLPQLKYALLSTAKLVESLQKSDFHQLIPSDRPKGYPERQRIRIDQAPWDIKVSDYDPPVYETPADILANMRSEENPNGWADQEDYRNIPGLTSRLSNYGPLCTDTEGRLQHPLGRQGADGRLLPKWGPNLSVDVVLSRVNGIREFQVLMGKRADTGDWQLIGGLKRDEESNTDAKRRILRAKAGIELPEELQGEVVHLGCTDDYRDTDRSWVEGEAEHFQLAEKESEAMEIKAGENFESIEWVTIDPGVINHMFAAHADMIRASIVRLAQNSPDSDLYKNLLATI